MSDAVAAIGATITIDGVPIEEVGDITGPSFSTETIDVTSHDSPGHGRERIPGMKDWGDVSFPMNAVPTAQGQQALYESWEEDPQVFHAFVITYTNEVSVTFQGFVTQWEKGAAIGDRNLINVTIAIAEFPTVAWGS